MPDVIYNPEQLIVNIPELLIPYTKGTNRGINLIANTSLQIAPVNLTRIYLIIVNLTDVPVWLSLGQNTAALNQGMPLFNKRSYFEVSKEALFRGQISAISDSPASLSFTECSL